MIGLAFFDDPGDPVAVLSADLFVQALEDLFQPCDLALRLLEVAFERLAQLRVRGRLRQFRQRLGQLFLGVIRVAQFVDECVVERACFSHGRISSVLFVNKARISHARWIGLPSKVPMLGHCRDERVGRIRRIGRRHDEAGVGRVGLDPARGEQLCALAEGQQGLAMAVLILDELERAPIGLQPTYGVSASGKHHRVVEHRWRRFEAHVHFDGIA